MRAPTARMATLLTVLAAVAWGTSFNVNDHGLRFVGPGTFVFLRFALAGTLFVGVLAFMGRLDTRFPRRPWFWLLTAMNALAFLLQYLGQTYTTPARTALFVNTSAFAVAILERGFYKMRIGPRRTLAILAGFVGAGVLVTGGDVSTLQGGRLVGDLLTLASGLAWSVYFVMNRDAVAADDTWNVLAWTFALSAVFLLPAAFFDAAPFVVPAEAWGSILWAGLVTTALTYALWTIGLRRIRATTSSVLLLVEVLVASTLSVLIGRETFGGWDVVGGSILLAAVVAISLLAPDDPKLDAPRDV